MTPLATQALEFIENRNWSMVPCAGDSKSPCVKWTPHQTALPTNSDLNRWDENFHPRRWGIVTGELSGVIAVDFDGEIGRQQLERWGLTPHVRSPSGGYHVYFEHPGWLVPTMNAKSSLIMWPFPGVDVRGDGGFIILLGSSAAGIYEILGDLKPCPFGQMPRELGNFLRDHSRSFHPDIPQELPQENTDETAGPTPFEVNNIRHKTNGKTDGHVDPSLLITRALNSALSNGRNNGGIWLAIQLRDNRVSKSDAQKWMLEYQSRAGDTNARGEREAYTRAEVIASLDSAYTRSPREPWAESPKKHLNGHAAKSDHSSPPVAVNEQAPQEETQETASDPLLKLNSAIAALIENKNGSGVWDPAFLEIVGSAGPMAMRDTLRLIRKEFPHEIKGLIFDWRAKVKEFFPRPDSHHIDDSPGSLQQIQTSNRQLRDITLESIQQIQAHNDPPSLFVRSGSLVHVIQDEKERPSVSIVTEPRLRGILARTANFMKFDRFGELKNAFPPPEVAKDILAFNPQSWPFPALSSVAEVPVLRHNGTILDQPGYDRESGIFYAPASTLKSFPLPHSPTQEDVRDARNVIEEAIGDFPYSDPASHANMYGLLLTPVLRPAITGCAPLAVIDAPMAGTGKSLITDVLSIITTGRPAAMMPYPYKEEEMQKQIAASLSAGRQLIVFDNLQGELRSPALALAITAKEFEARILGVSRNMTVPNVSTWIVTGNNIKPAGDMPRRCYQIRLNAQAAKPYMGRTFKHPKLLQWVTSHRSELLHALLVIARYWYANGRKSYVSSTVGSFEDWHQTIGSIVTHARIPGFLENYTSFIEQEDESPRQWEGFLAGLFEHYRSTDDTKSRPFTVASMLDRSFTDTAIRDLFPAEIADCIEKKGNHRISVGKMFRSRRETRFGYGDFQYWLARIIDDTEHKGSAEWCVNRAQAAKSIISTS